MNKEELIELFKTYKQKQSKKDLRLEEEKMLLKEKEKLEEDYNTNINVQYIEGGRSNQTISKVENKVCRKDERLLEIDERVKVLEDEIEGLNYELNQVNIRLGSLNRLEKEVVTAYYIDGMDYDEIGNIVYYNVKHQTRSGDTIKRMIGRIMRKLEKL